MDELLELARRLLDLKKEKEEHDASLNERIKDVVYSIKKYCEKHKCL